MARPAARRRVCDVERRMMAEDLRRQTSGRQPILGAHQIPTSAKSRFKLIVTTRSPTSAVGVRVKQ